MYRTIISFTCIIVACIGNLPGNTEKIVIRDLHLIGNNTISLNQYLSTSKESIQKIEGNKNSLIKDVGKEVKVVEEEEHTKKCNKELLFKWEQLKENISEFEGVDVVVHAAARAHIMNDDVFDSLAQFRKVNRDVTLLLARLAAEAGIKRFVFLS